MSDKRKPRWYKEPEKQDYAAAITYLTLLIKAGSAKKLVHKLRAATAAKFQAKDIFRASTLPMLSINNQHVAKEYDKIMRGDKLAPLLLVRDSAMGKVVIADGYHRLCAVYSLNENADIPCKLV